MTTTTKTVLTEDQIRTIVREETADMRVDFSILKEDVGDLKRKFYEFGIMVEEMRTMIDSMLDIMSEKLEERCNLHIHCESCSVQH